MLTSEDIAVISGMDKGMSPYESFIVSEKTGKRASNTSIVGITIASAAALIGIGAWIFGGVYTKQGQTSNLALINSNAEHSRQMENLLATSVTSERNERIGQQPTFSDYISLVQNQTGSQTSTTSSNALAQAEATLLTQSLLGNMQSCPQKVSLYSAPQPCSCPGSCN